MSTKIFIALGLVEISVKGRGYLCQVSLIKFGSLAARNHITSYNNITTTLTSLHTTTLTHITTNHNNSITTTRTTTYIKTHNSLCIR